MERLKRWLARHYIASLLGSFFLLTVVVMLSFIEVRHLFPGFGTEYLTTGFQFLAAVLAGLSSSIAVIYVANLQNKAQREFLLTQELHERERLLLGFYIDKIKEFEDRHRQFISYSTELIHNAHEMTGLELKGAFSQITDSLVLVYRYHHVFRHMELDEQWSKLGEQVGKLHQFFTEATSKQEGGARTVDLGQEFKDQFYLPITAYISTISDQLLLYQEKRIVGLLDMDTGDLFTSR